MVWVLEISFFIVVLRIIARDNFIARLGCLMAVAGLVMNACVTQLNGGVMPVVGMPSSFQPAGPLWVPAAGGHLLFMADHAANFYFSIGDILLRGGFAILATSWLVSRVSGLRENKLRFEMITPVFKLPKPSPSIADLRRPRQF